jgi:hypothetical protein
MGVGAGNTAILKNLGYGRVYIKCKKKSHYILKYLKSFFNSVSVQFLYSSCITKQVAIPFKNKIYNKLKFMTNTEKGTELGCALCS